MTDVQISRAGITDLREIAKCHIESFPNSVISLLGIRYTIKLLSWFLNIDFGYVLKISKDNHVIGYVGGYIGSQRKQTFKELVRFTIVDVAINFLQKPYLLIDRRIWSRLKLYSWDFLNRPSKDILDRSSKPMVNYIVSLCIHPRYRGKKYGGLLIDNLSDLKGFPSFSSIVLDVSKQNNEALSFYLNKGFQILNENNDISYTLIKNIDENEKSNY